MKKRMISILLCAMIGVMMIGCGSSEKDDAGKTDNLAESGSEADDESETQTIDKDFSLQMTDSYTFTDPQELDFDQRLVLEGDENCKLLSDMANMGYKATNIYLIMYAKDGLAVGEYQYFVTPDETSAKELADFYSSQGQQITQEGNILYAYSEADIIQATITTFASMGTLPDETPEAYVEMMKSFNGLVEYE